jgi:hypothetical protein
VRQDGTKLGADRVGIHRFGGRRDRGQHGHYGLDVLPPLRRSGRAPGAGRRGIGRRPGGSAQDERRVGHDEAHAAILRSRGHEDRLDLLRAEPTGEALAHTPQQGLGIVLRRAIAQVHLAVDHLDRFHHHTLRRQLLQFDANIAGHAVAPAISLGLRQLPIALLLLKLVERAQQLLGGHYPRPEAVIARPVQRAGVGARRNREFLAAVATPDRHAVGADLV